MARRLLFVLPAVAAVIVLWAVLRAGKAEAVLAVQIYGGPTDAGVRSLLVLALRGDGAQTRGAPGLPLRVVARAAGSQAEWSGSTDAMGQTEVTFNWSGAAPPSPELLVLAAETGEVLGQGVLALPRERWLDGASRRGGWLEGRLQGALALRVAAAEGTLAVPFESELLVEVSRVADSAPSAAALLVELDGAERTLPPGAEPVPVAASGLARFRLRPDAHAISLRLRAEAPNGERGEWFGALPVVPGALHARLIGERLQVRSPIERSHAYVSLVNESERLAGVIAELEPAPNGEAALELPLAPELRARLEREPVWAVVSSELDKRSPGVVGWPLGAAARLVPPHTFEVADRLLLDTLPESLAQERELRLGRRRLAAWLLVAVGGLMTLLLWREVQKRPRPALPSALDAAEASAVLPKSPGWLLWVALGSVACGLCALAYFSLIAR